MALAALEVASGRSDVALALGVDKAVGMRMAPAHAGIESLEGGTVVPFTHFALLANRYMTEHGVERRARSPGWR